MNRHTSTVQLKLEPPNVAKLTWKSTRLTPTDLGDASSQVDFIYGIPAEAVPPNRPRSSFGPMITSPLNLPTASQLIARKSPVLPVHEGGLRMNSREFIRRPIHSTGPWTCKQYPSRQTPPNYPRSLTTLEPMRNLGSLQ